LHHRRRQFADHELQARLVHTVIAASHPVTLGVIELTLSVLAFRSNCRCDYISYYSDYMQVGIRELKAKLSEYVSLAEQGRDIVVTDRGRPVARLLPYSETSAFDRGVAEGWIEAPRRVGLAPHTPHSAKESILAVLADDRG
jgi:prevent-host-death family protein